MPLAKSGSRKPRGSADVDWTCDQYCWCHIPVRGASQPPCYQCVLIQCSLSFKPDFAPSAPQLSPVDYSLPTFTQSQVLDMTNYTGLPLSSPEGGGVGGGVEGSGGGGGGGGAIPRTASSASSTEPTTSPTSPPNIPLNYFESQEVQLEYADHQLPSGNTDSVEGISDTPLHHHTRTRRCSVDMTEEDVVSPEGSRCASTMSDNQTPSLWPRNTQMIDSEIANSNTPEEKTLLLSDEAVRNIECTGYALNVEDPELRRVVTPSRATSATHSYCQDPNDLSIRLRSLILGGSISSPDSSTENSVLSDEALGNTEPVSSDFDVSGESSCISKTETKSSPIASDGFVSNPPIIYDQETTHFDSSFQENCDLSVRLKSLILDPEEQESFQTNRDDQANHRTAPTGNWTITGKGLSVCSCGHAHWCYPKRRSRNTSFKKRNRQSSHNGNRSKFTNPYEARGNRVSSTLAEKEFERINRISGRESEKEAAERYLHQSTL